ncbi:MAG: beta-glucosidase [Candidatus Azotimanducaceae bacterium]|jgi:beta-glucosidase
MKNFPKTFYWGAATASYQVEGGIENCDWAQAAREGKVPKAGKLADHYHLYEKDFDLAKDLGHNAHRFSVEWARIEPEEGVFDEAEIEHYREVLLALKARGLKPYLTLWHFTLPLWFSESGGFERKDAPEVFARYCTYVVERLQDLCNDFATINEPMVYLNNGWIRGQWPPFKRWTLFNFVKVSNSGADTKSTKQNSFGALFTFLKVKKTLALAHVAAYEAIKRVRPSSEVSIIRDVIVFDANWNPFNKILAYVMNWYWTHWFNNQAQNKFDAIGLNYYFYKKFGDKKEYLKSDMNWDVIPEGVYDALMLLKRYNKPVFVAEVGIADANDDLRPDYIRAQIAAIQKAIEDGVDVRGHMYWSLIDNYEWALGTKQQFGLIEIDYDTLMRKVRPSAQVYKKIIQNNGILS